MSVEIVENIFLTSCLLAGVSWALVFMAAGIDCEIHDAIAYSITITAAVIPIVAVITGVALIWM